MKTVSTPSEFDDVLSNNDGIVTCVSSKVTYEGNQGQNNNFSQNDCQPQIDCVGTKNLICDSNLSQALQSRKCDKKISPGHYLQKVFFNYNAAQKLGSSQSLPSCVVNNNFSGDKSKSKDDAKSNQLDDVNCSENVSEQFIAGKITSLDVCGTVDTKLIGSSNDSWFKTWPERGIGVDKKQGNPFNDCPTDLSDTHSALVVKGCNRTSLEVNPDKTELGSPQQQKYIDLATSKPCVGNSPVHLKHILETLPLGYSPLTKQLHIIDRKSKSHDDEFLNDCSIKEKVNFDPPNNSSSDFMNGTKLKRDICKLHDASKKHLHDCDIGTTLPILNSNISDKDNCLGGNLTRVATDASCCSYSSTVSSLSDVSPSTNEDSALGSLLGLDHGDSCSVASIGECSILSEDNTGAASSSPGPKQKKKSFSGFFSRLVNNLVANFTLVFFFFLI